MEIISRALAFVSRWFDAATVARVFEPLIADWQREWLDASGVHRWRVLLRGWCALVCAVVVSSPRILVVPTPGAVTMRIVSRIASFAVLATLVTVLPFAFQLELGQRAPLLLLLLAPSSLALVFPFAMIAAVDAIRCDHALPPHVERAAAAKVAFAACLFMLLLMGWGVPAANQAWRTAMAPAGANAPARGVRELTITELFTDPSLATANDGTNASGRAAVIVREINSRLSLVALPVMLLWLRWRLLDLPRRRWSPLPPSVIAIAAFVAFGMLRGSDRIIEDVLALRPGAGPWSPLVIIGLAMVLDTFRRSRVRGVA